MKWLLALHLNRETITTKVRLDPEFQFSRVLHSETTGDFTSLYCCSDKAIKNHSQQFKKKTYKSLYSYYTLEIRAINPFLYDPYLCLFQHLPLFSCADLALERRDTPRMATVRVILEYHTSRLTSWCSETTGSSKLCLKEADE